MIQRSSTFRRSRHGKRLPQNSDTGTNTPTVDNPTTSAVVTPTVTVFVFPSSSTDPASSIPTTSPDPDSSTIIDDPSTSSVSSDSGYQVSSATMLYSVATTSDTSTTITAAVDASQTSNVVASTAASSSSTPIGAIVGIILGILLLLAAGAGFWFRRRAVANRMKTRHWTKQENDPSFLWLEPNDPAKITPYPVPSSSTVQPSRGGDSVNGGLVTQSSPRPSNNGLPFVPYPTPPRPPPAAGIYDLPAHSPRATIVTLSPMTPSHAPLPFSPVLPLTVPNSPASSRLAAETAKVRSTFIPTLPDELAIGVGDMLRILAEYDDGWVLCSNARGEKGMVPLECLDKASQLQSPAREYKKLARTSSLAATAKAQYSRYQ